MATQLDIAEQQLWGYHCAENGERLQTLVVGMGLTQKEWENLKESGRVKYLSDDERYDIDRYFMSLTP